MGMSATQARLLQLTSILNDVEFEGQQINMARTQLSSTSARFYNQLLSMEVPTPPVKSDYTNLTYTYNANGADYTITNIGNLDADGNAVVTTQHTGHGATVTGTGEYSKVTVTEKKVKDEEKGIICTSSKDNLYTEDGTSYTPIKKATAYSEGATYVDSTGASVDVAAAVSAAIGTGNFIGADGKVVSSYTMPMYSKGEQKTQTVDDTSKPITDDDGNVIGYEQKEEPIDEWELGTEYTPETFFGQLNLGGDVNQVVDEGEATSFIGTAAKTVQEYTIDGQTPMTFDDIPEGDETRAELETAIAQTGKNPDDYYIIPDGNSYKLYLKSDVKDGNDSAEILDATYTNSALYTEETNANLEFGTNGRISSITLPDGTKIAVTPVVETDELAYEDAYSQYTYEKQLYDKDQAAINAQLSTIQAQDKKLELQLTELDTRRTQITTELDALQTVLGDNIERTYKTFSG